MYGLKQDSRLTFDNLGKLLAPYGYFPVQESPGLWILHNCLTVLTLCVDDFGIKAISLDCLHHPINAIKLYFKLSINWGRHNYRGLTSDWSYAKKYVYISMPGYIPTAQYKFQHKPSAHDQDARQTWNKTIYVKQIQLSTQQNSAPKINSADTNCVQSVNSNLFNYVCTVHPNMLPAIK